MIQFIESATERTTAATDLILAVEFFLFAIFFIKSASGNKRAAAWSIPFLLLAGAFLIGAIAHGFQMPEKTNMQLWLLLAGCSAFGLAHLVSASVGEWKPAWYKKSVVGMSLAAIIFVGTTVKFSSFTVYVVFILITMALVSWLNAMCFERSGNKNYLLIIFGAVITATASLVQLITSIHFTIIWEFDYNGAFHLIQMLAGIFLALGITGLMKSACSGTRTTERGNSDISNEEKDC
ncbi:MAG: hypothetical protein QNK19_02080 [Xanthomonadales bacterium]|nr:hypothetical protein [Xanthomonadales bacterium]